LSFRQQFQRRPIYLQSVRVQKDHGARGTQSTTTPNGPKEYLTYGGIRVVANDFDVERPISFLDRTQRLLMFVVAFIENEMFKRGGRIFIARLAEPGSVSVTHFIG
jgi:hypothetical protein